MQLGKSILGAIIGAAVGIGVLAAVYLLFGIDHVALAIVVALLTGLGVRALVSTSGHASYARGALTGILALGAYVAGWFVVAEFAKARAASMPKPAQIAAVGETAPDDNGGAAPAGGEVAVVEVRQPLAGTPGAGMPKAGAPGQNPLDYLWLAIAGLVAYELGRGSGTESRRQEPTDGTGDGDPALARGPEPASPPPQVVAPPD